MSNQLIGGLDSIISGLFFAPPKRGRRKERE